MSRPRVTAQAVREAARAGRWAMTYHARLRSRRRMIRDRDVAWALAEAEVLEEYPDDPRGPSALVLGHAEDGRPIHAVCTFDESGTLVLITVYEPGPPKWIDERTRAQKGEQE